MGRLSTTERTYLPTCLAQDTAHAIQHTERHTDEQEPSGPGHSRCNTMHRGSTPVNRS